MTTDEKSRINEMRQQGCTYVKIGVMQAAPVLFGQAPHCVVVCKSQHQAKDGEG